MNAEIGISLLRQMRAAEDEANRLRAILEEIARSGAHDEQWRKYVLVELTHEEWAELEEFR